MCIGNEWVKIQESKILDEAEIWERLNHRRGVLTQKIETTDIKRNEHSEDLTGGIL